MLFLRARVRTGFHLVRNIILILFVLVGSYTGATPLVGNTELAGRISIAALFCFTALGHFVRPNEMLEMLPPWVPTRKLVVLLSGLLELAFAIGILIPLTSRLTAISAIIFLFLAAPLNIYAAYRRVNFGGHASGPGYLFIRLPLQIFLIAWIWWFAMRTRHKICDRQPRKADHAAKVWLANTQEMNN